MKNLILKALTGLLFLLIILAAALFVSAGTLDYWQAWVFLAVFGISVLAITLYLMKNDPQLLERRTVAGPGAEREKSQNVIQSFASLAFIAIFVFCALDHRNQWSNVPAAFSVIGDILVALGLFLVFLVFKENSFTSAVIEVSSEQKIITTGPYAYVRHPMYISALIMLLGVPLALGSWWGLITLIPITLVIVLRLLDEEQFLIKNLPGYADYRTKVRYRLLPYIW